MELFGITRAGIQEEDHIRRVQLLKKIGITPKLIIIQTTESKVIDLYVRVKKKYALRIGVEVEHIHTNVNTIIEAIDAYNQDLSVHSIIVQLPLDSKLRARTILDRVVSTKDVDGLSLDTVFVPPTAQAIYALLQESRRNLIDEKIAIVGHGMLVGKPVEELLRTQGLLVTIFVKGDNLENLGEYTVIISGVGVPAVIRSAYVASGTLLIDAGTAEESGSIVGDVEDILYERDDVTISAKKGGVGLLTVRNLYENVLRSAEAKF